VIQTRCFERKILWGICLFITLSSCEKKQKRETLFNKVPSTKTKISFENTLTDSDDFNIIEYLYFYNGAGVAIGDINNDSLPDIYFSSNQGDNKLYLNKGDMEFEDITSSANVVGVGNWKTGVTMADVNGDGFLDIFICGVGNYKKFNGRNQLLINNGDLTFSDMTAEYGLSFQGFSTQAAFFDYDNDGDLDMYLVNHSVHTKRAYGHATLRYESDPLAGDKLYQNELIPNGNFHFREVTAEAGILNSHIGYGLGVGVSDLDQDGDLDIYVSNDFNENDYLYINQGNGTFLQELENSIPHSSRFSMGNDIADINNDGLMDILTLDMLPKEEAIIKTTAGEDAYEIYAFKLQYGYHYQVSRNTLQLNRGLDAKGKLMFSDIAPFAGVEATDWSWAPLLADFDNDGYKDLFVANGIVGRPNDLDYINYITTDSAQRYFTDHQLVEQMPAGKVANVIFKNLGDRTFRDVSREWIAEETTLSNGAAYADLDNDGDLDLVVNNINEQAMIYRNDLQAGTGNFLKIRLEGNAANLFGVGAKVIVYRGHQQFVLEQVPTRGWLSSVDYSMHFGLGKLAMVDSLSVFWPDSKSQTLKSVLANQTIVLRQSDAISGSHHGGKQPVHPKLLSEQQDIAFEHRENSFVAFNVERLIPHMLSTQGPALAVGDINGDALDDFFIGGAAGQPGAVFVQDAKGNFRLTSQPAIASDMAAEDIGASFFDANGNGVLDLIVVSGGQEFNSTDKHLAPRLYENDGKGNFGRLAENLPDIYVNASCVKPADVDRDGDIDLFIGGSVIPGKYGIDPPSYLLINDGNGVFADNTVALLRGGNDTRVSVGMVTDAEWSDVNNDGRVDLIVVGEWMPISVFLQHESGVFENRTDELGLNHTNGWWNTITSYDFDQDGDMDFIAGNLGLNSRLRASIAEPVSIFIGDIDNNNSLDQILTYYNQGRRYPLISRDQLVKQIPALRRRFLKYANYRNVSLEDIIEPALLKTFKRKDVFTFASVYVENLGNGKFSVSNLPLDGQLFPIFSFSVDDLNGDGNADVMAVGNLDATQPDFGRYDAGYGVILLGDGKGSFESITSQKSGFIVKGQGRNIKSLLTPTKKKRFLIARNNDSVKVFEKQINK